MFFRIMSAPPGYGPEERFMVAGYPDRDFRLPGFSIFNDEGSRFAASLEEARAMLPKNAKRLPYERYCQYLELWELPESENIDE